jgi:isoamylase
VQILPGSPYPLGARWDGDGANFALYSEHASAVELCLFDDAGVETRANLPHCTAFIWHGYVSGIRAGQRYGYRVHGPYEPERGLRFNPNVVLLDPYARAVDRVESWDLGCFAYELAHADQDLRATDKPQLGAPRAVVIDPEFDWGDDEPLQIPMHQSIIYEAHVKGLTKLHPDVPEALRGTYSGIAHPAILRYLRDLGITAIELLPVHAFVDDKILLDKGLRNYWGYNSIGFFAPDVRYSSGRELGSEVREFKAMVKALHRAGIEVILDVVYNHSAEGNHLGPTLSLKGIDNPTYYRLVSDNPRCYFDYTGTGNTLNVRHPQVLTLIMDSLRYWASEMHVDGFRFDLASALARQLHEVDKLSSFFTLIHQAPQLSHVKIIAEPWDVGEGGYQVGNFPVRWSEWNGRYRDAVRALWLRQGARLGEIGYRLTGSGDLYQANGRSPAASVNLISAHDGFTLADLVSYDQKHNELNGEENRDGSNHEQSWNSGVEGPTDDVQVNALRARQMRNLLATLLLSQGTPLLVAGDEFGRTQKGNNNAYCQDNEISWLDWRWSERESALFEFTKRLLRLRRDHPSLHRSKFFRGRAIHGTELQDLLWFRPDGVPMSDAEWNDPARQSLVVFLAGRGIDDVDEAGSPLVDDDLLLLINATSSDASFVIPELERVREDWRLLVDTADTRAEERRRAGENTLLASRSLKFFRAPSSVIRRGGSLHRLGATYRLQLNAQFGFEAARAVADYLAELGVTDVYASPICAAVPGSTHGYDVVDYGRLNPELGWESDFEAWSDRLEALGLGLLLDWVPNHMGITSGHNHWWDDVLENGPSSQYADFFDIVWSVPTAENPAGRLLLPILADQYGEVLERGDLSVVWYESFFKLAYYDRRLPLAPHSLIPILEVALTNSGLAEDRAERQELESILFALRHLPPRHESEPRGQKERAREKEIIKRRLALLAEQSTDVARGIGEAIRDVNGLPGAPQSFDRLDEILKEQSYRLASWRVAAEEINYRRFFDVNDLAAVRMELPEVFARSHELLFRLMTQERIQALRLDHTDGLYDPEAYFESLQRRFHSNERANREQSPDDLVRPVPILVEKILEPGEQLPEAWRIDGTTGYEFLVACRGLFVARHSEEELTQLYQRFTGDRRTFAEHVQDSKRYVLRFSLWSEVNMLAGLLKRIAGKKRRSADFTLTSLARALSELLIAFPVYRTYVRENERCNPQDERQIRQAIDVARRANPAIDESVWSFLTVLLLLEGEGSADERQEQAAFSLRFQQLTGPVMAKSIEDTAFYRYPRLECLNEVGGAPARFGTTVEEFHRLNRERARSWPLSMVTTSTHDTKRGEDASARIAVLSEMPGEWRKAVTRWSTFADRCGSPSTTVQYLFYQVIVGAWPFGWNGVVERDAFVSRIDEFMRKAGREAKQDTSWAHPNIVHETRVSDFVRGMFENVSFVTDMREFCERLAPYAATNSLAQCVLRLAVPGVADTYQGSELWNQWLVDPDNRRPVDYDTRRRYLSQIRERAFAPADLAKELLRSFVDGRVKLYVTHRALMARKERRDLFLRGDYEDLPGSEHVIAFTRDFQSQRLVCCVPRLSFIRTRGERPWPLGEVWQSEQLRLPDAGTYRNVFTGASITASGSLKLADVFAEFPVALLLSEP